MTEPTLDLPAPSPEAAGAPAADAAAADAAAAPAKTGTLVLVVPQPVARVASTQAEGSVLLSEADRAKVDAMVSDYLESVSSLDTHSQAFSDKVKDIAKLGDDDIRASAAVSNRLLEKPLAAMQSGGLTEASEVSHSLLALRRQVEDLDPAHQGDLLSPRKLLGLILFGDRLRDYFDKYRSSQHQLDAIITTLYHGQDELQRDNAAIEQEKVTLWAVMGRLRQYAYLAQRLDEALSAKVATIEATDPERAKVLKEDLLFYVRQKHQDLLTQLAVSIQGYLALDVVRRNNLELIKGVQRATTTTVSACGPRSSWPRRSPIRSLCSTRSRRSTRRRRTSSSRPPRCSGRSRPRSTSRPPPRPSSSTSCRPRSRTSTRRWTRSTPSRSRRSTRCRRP